MKCVIDSSTFMILLHIILVLLISSTSATVSVQDAKNFAAKWANSADVSVYSNFARSLQLSSFGDYGKSRNFTQLQEFIDKDIMALTANPSAAINNPTIIQIIVPIAIGLVLAFAVPIGGVIWLLFRRCNCCGGARPSKEGYDHKSIMIYSIVFGTLVILNIVFASLFIIYSFQTTATVNSLTTGYSNFAVNTVAAIDDTVTGLETSPQAFEKAKTSILTRVQSGDIQNHINSTFYASINDLDSNLNQIESLKRSILISLNNTQRDIDNLTTTSNYIPVRLAGVGSSIVALKPVTINGTVYNINGFPDVSELFNSTGPDLSSLPSTASQRNAIQNSKNMTAVSEDMKSVFSTLPKTIVDTLTNAISAAIGSETGTQLSGGLVDSMKSVRNDAQKLLVTDTQKYLTDVSQYDNYRNYAMLGEMGIIILLSLVAVAGTIFKKRGLMTPFCATILILSFLIWLQFVIFYLLSAPFNLACNSKSALLSSTFSLTASNVTLKVTPQVLLDECVADKKIFTAKLSSDGGNFTSLIDSLVNGVMGSSFNADKIATQTNFPNFDQTMNSIDTGSLGTFNATSFGNVRIAIGANITKIVSNIRTAMGTFSPMSLDTDLGDFSKMSSSISNFNAAVTAALPAAPLFNFTYIVNAYVIPKRPFWGSDITQSSNHPKNADLESAYANFRVSERVGFIYLSQIELARVNNTLESLIGALNFISGPEIDSIKVGSAQIQSNAAIIEGFITSIQQIVSNIKNNSGKNLNNAQQKFVDWMVSFASSLISGGIATITQELFTKNTVAPDFGNCKGIANSLNYVADGICIGTVDVLSGLWLTSAILGILLLVGFVAVVLTKKRIAYLQNRGNTVKDGKSLSDYEKGAQQNASDYIISSQAVDDDEFHDAASKVSSGNDYLQEKKKTMSVKKGLKMSDYENY